MNFNVMTDEEAIKILLILRCSIRKKFEGGYIEEIETAIDKGMQALIDRTMSDNREEQENDNHS